MTDCPAGTRVPAGQASLTEHRQNGSMPNAHRRTQDLPQGYPSSYESVVRLADRRKVTITPIVSSDAAELAEAIRTADADTIHARFLGGPPPLTEAVLDGLTRIDYVRRFALVARSHGRGVAIARYGALPPSEGEPGVAEVAVAVAPEWRHAGLATVLVEMLARRALECGITEFTAMFLAANRPVTELAHDGQARVVVAEGVAQLHAALTEPHPNWPGLRHSGNGHQ